MDIVQQKPSKGICCDSAHSMKNGITEYRANNLETGQLIFYKNIGNKSINVGEFLALVDSIKWIIEHDFPDKTVYSDSMTAITWFCNRKTYSKLKSNDLNKAEIYLKVMDFWVSKIKVIHWDKNLWGEIPSDFGNK